jgi:hypothetical protein
VHLEVPDHGGADWKRCQLKCSCRSKAARADLRESALAACARLHGRSRAPHWCVLWVVADGHAGSVIGTRLILTSAASRWPWLSSRLGSIISGLSTGGGGAASSSAEQTRSSPGAAFARACEHFGAVLVVNPALLELLHLVVEQAWVDVYEEL